MSSYWKSTLVVIPSMTSSPRALRILAMADGRSLSWTMSFKIMEAVRKGKVKGGKAGDWPMWVEEMRKHDVPEWYIESLAKIGYLFPKAHAVAYVMMAFRIAWFKVHEPLAFYATFFSIRAKAFDAAECCKDADALAGAFTTMV